MKKPNKNASVSKMPKPKKNAPKTFTPSTAEREVMARLGREREALTNSMRSIILEKRAALAIEEGVVFDYDLSAQVFVAVQPEAPKPDGTA